MQSVVLAHGLVPCPATLWSPAAGASPAAADRAILRPVLVPPSAAGDVEAQLVWLHENADGLMTSLGEAGALHFRGFSAATTKSGFRRFCEALPLQPCATPLHTNAPVAHTSRLEMHAHMRARTCTYPAVPTHWRASACARCSHRPTASTRRSTHRRATPHALARSRRRSQTLAHARTCSHTLAHALAWRRAATLCTQAVAVCTQALAATYLGLHNDATWALTAPFAAFVCFEPAPSGGAFLVADGRRALARPRALQPRVSAGCQPHVSAGC